uniref:SJCHGC05672 protein n=1 Tax=Schistosoma japonicum TaxID=6182 RepID=Q5DCP0_SCHJA|nr:SJCHGC05672 protein [Schistosoma japonicum]
MENGEDEEDDDNLSEISFYQTQLQTVQLRSKVINNHQQNNSRAPTMTIDVVRVNRPLKILALILSFLSLLLFIVGSVSTSWITIHFKTIGLFQQCDNLIKQMNNIQLSFNVEHNNQNNQINEIERICHLRDLSNNLSALFFTILGSSFLLSGIFSLNIKRKRAFYYTSVVLHIISCILILSASILLIIQCVNEVKQNFPSENQSIITVGWSLILIWCGIVILSITICLVLFDKGGEEIEYRETIHRSSNFVEES